MPTVSHVASKSWRTITATVRRLVVVAVGFALCGAGLTMLVLPGPGIIVVVAGLVVLATEYFWAHRALERSRSRANDATTRLHASRTARLGVAVSAAALITGGAAAAAIADGYRYIGISVLIAGIGTVAILIPATQRLIERPIRPPSSRRRTNTPDTTIDSPSYAKDT
jgi:hypothetical protein